MTSRTAAFLGALAAIGSATATSAEPVTYSGTLGNIPIVVEFAGDPTATDAAPDARYFYVAHGIDIPLHGRPNAAGGFSLDEEAACAEERCDTESPAAIAATWTLSAAGRGTLEGTWSGGRSLPVKLTRVASRPQLADKPATPYGLYAFSDETFLPGGLDITMETSPYDRLRLDVPLGETVAQGWPDATYRYVSDPRTVFRMPRIVELARETSADPANDLLRQRHWQASRNALACAALRYRGFLEDGVPAPWGAGTLAGYDESQSEVLLLTPALMSWSESGSLFCGGAHPHNYRDRFVMDVAAGTLLELGDMFAGASTSDAGDALTEFVRQKKGRTDDPIQAEFEEECGIDDLIRTNLSAHLRRDGDEVFVVFGISGLGHAMGACEDDILQLHASEAETVSTPRFLTLLGQ